jgi:hypothetical protein
VPDAAHLSPQRRVAAALEEFGRSLSFIDEPKMPAWAKEPVAAVRKLIPKGGEEREQWNKEASEEKLTKLCEALLTWFAATEFEHGRQSR